MSESGFGAKVHAVFVHTQDLKKSAAWYSDLLGLPFYEEKVESPVYNMPVTGETYMTLDDHAFDPDYQFEPVRTPVFNFCSADLAKSYQWVKEKGIMIVRDIEEHGDFGWFHIEDPDKNVVMICGTVQT
ncbi:MULTISPECIES: VOC family protein [Thalassobacillus]|uniref:VOC family protein n=1 Tax=Thalassobacillus TaxID=331971 RepID=UPI000A1CE96A|nr:VOC family protein [Thalassobacillus devorans]